MLDFVSKLKDFLNREDSTYQAKGQADEVPAKMNPEAVNAMLKQEGEKDQNHLQTAIEHLDAHPDKDDTLQAIVEQLKRYHQLSSKLKEK